MDGAFSLFGWLAFLSIAAAQIAEIRLHQRWT
jgi:hypothetical protein